MVKNRIATRTVAGVLLLAGLTAALCGRARTQAQSCVGGNPYCYNTTLVPCQAGTCVAWATAFPSTPAPICNEGEKGPIATAAVTISVTAIGWYACQVSNDDSDTCGTTGNVCANYTTYQDTACKTTCAIGIVTPEYCDVVTNESDACGP